MKKTLQELNSQTVMQKNILIATKNDIQPSIRYQCEETCFLRYTIMIRGSLQIS